IDSKEYTRCQNNAQHLLFGLLSHPIQLDGFNAEQLIEMFGKCGITATQAIEKSESYDLSPRGRNLLRVYALSDSQYINTIHKDEKGKIRETFKDAVSKLSLEELPNRFIEK